LFSLLSLRSTRQTGRFSSPTLLLLRPYVRASVTTRRREKWREKDKTTVGWRAFEVLKPRSWEPNTEGLKPRCWDPNTEGLKPTSWDPGPETSRWGPETQVLRAKSWNLALTSWNSGLESQISRSWNPGPDSVRALLIGWSN
jgi:hypothetical protein